MQLGYINSNLKYMTVEEQKQSLQEYANNINLPLDKILIDNELKDTDFLNNPKDIWLIMPNVMAFGNRYEEILKMMQSYIKIGVSLNFIKEKISINAKSTMDFNSCSEICFIIFKSVLSIKNKDIVANIRKSGRSPGRKLGSKNATTIIENKKEEILALKAQGLNNQEIAKRIGCGKTTLYKFYKKMNMEG